MIKFVFCNWNDNEFKETKVFFCCVLIGGILIPGFAVGADDPCGGPTALLSIIDRPTVSDSACVVPFKQAVLEVGYQYQQLTHNGHQQNFPEAVFRVGLPLNNEFVILIPNYIKQSFSPHSGFTGTTLGIKHEIGYNTRWLGAVEGLYTPPARSAHFGNKGSQGAINGIVSYTFNPQFNLTLMLGATTQTLSTHDGGRRFYSVNPDLVFTYTPVQKIDLYAEFFGQSKAGPGMGSGLNFDAGIIYLLLPNTAVDLEIGQRISGSLGGFNHYVGTGVSFLF